jgi:hypothetical protein
MFPATVLDEGPRVLMTGILYIVLPGSTRETTRDRDDCNRNRNRNREPASYDGAPSCQAPEVQDSRRAVQQTS